MRKTAAWPLALVYLVLVVYASLFPFEGWRGQGVPFWGFLLEPAPRYWSGFDVLSNVLGYMPLGFLLALVGLRTQRHSGVVAIATAAAAVLSLSMESLQTYLPQRVPSNVDLALNVLGAWLGALVALVLQRLGVLWHWGRQRQRWLSSGSHGMLVLLALWPAALLFPAPVALGLGQVYERVIHLLAAALQGSAFAHWLPQALPAQLMLEPLAQAWCVALGLWAPCLLGYLGVRHRLRRLVLLLVLLGLGVGVTALSTALSWGPAHALSWLDPPTRVGLMGGLGLALLSLWLPQRLCAALLLLALALQLFLLNLAPANPYFALTLHVWEQGRFMRFHGLSQWLGWLWPYATLTYALVWLSSRESGHVSAQGWHRP